MVKLLAICLALAAARAQSPADPDAPKQPAFISGTVMQSDGSPMRDVQVAVPLGAGKSISVMTDAGGRYSLKDIPPGQQRVLAAGPDREGRIAGFGPNGMRQVTLRPGEDLRGFDFRLVVRGRIAGKVVDQNNEPVPGLRVVAVTREYHAGALRAVMTSGATTDDLGEYVLDRVEPGRAYAVMADHGGNRISAYSDAPLDPALRRPAVARTYYPNTRVLEGAEPVVLRDGETREGVDIKIARTPAFCVEARISGGLGPRAYFSIGPVQPASGNVGTGASYHAVPGAPVPSDGKVRICDLAPGDYEFVVSEAGAGTFADLVNFATATLAISDRDISNFNLVARPRVPLKGEVTWFGAAPDPPLEGKLRLLLQAITRTNRANTTAPIPGEFSFDSVPMDEYRMDISSVPDGVYVKDVVYGDRSVLLTTIRPGAAMLDAPLRITLAGDGGHIEGSVADKDGNPAPECSVIILPETAPNDAMVAASMRISKSDQSGRWRTVTMAPGKYIVLATMDTVNRSPETVGKIWKARTRGETVEIAKGGKPSVKLEPKPLD
jgi:Carboxypeptidase regulatory-like domain